MGFLRPKTDTTAKQQPKILNHIRVQTSIYGKVIPIIYGQDRIPANLIWTGDFTAIPHTSQRGKGGKGLFGGGGGQAQTTFTFETSAMFALCEGPITDLLGIWSSKGKFKLLVIKEQRTVPTGGGTITPTLGVNDTFYLDGGVTRLDSYSVNANDFGSPGVVTLTGNQETPLAPVAASPAAGQYAVNATTGVYTFAAGDAGKTVSLQFAKAVKDSNSNGVPISKLQVTLFKGTRPQTPWGYLTTNHPSEALGYSGTALVANSKWPLGSGGEFSNHNWEIRGFLPFGGGVVDANPKAVANDLLTSALYGMGWDVARIGDWTGWSNYCVASGLFISLLMDSQRPASDWLEDLLVSTNSNCFWSEGKLKIKPYGDTTLVANGVTYVPDTAPIYDLNDSDYLEVIQTTRPTVQDAENAVTIEYLDRDNDYNPTTVEAKVDWHIAKYGLRKSDPVQMHWIKSKTVAAIIADFLVKRSVFIRKSYRVVIGPRYQLLEQMDLVTLTDSQKGMDKVPVRVKSIDEDEDGTLTLECEEFPWGTATQTLYPKEAPSGFVPNVDADPGSVNTPIIFEASNRLGAAQSGQQIYCALSGASADWGGCSVHVSLDNATYRKVGEFHGRSRTGVTTSILPNVADPDITSVLGVDLTSSLGTLNSATVAEADALASLCLVESEIIGYTTATLTATNKYNLTTRIRRGLLSTAVASHASGVRFARLDDALFLVPYDAIYAGQTIWFKFASFNTNRRAEQDLANVTAYQYTVSATYLQDDIAFASAPQSLTGQWTKGAGFNWQWKPPATANLTIDGYYCFAKAPDGTFMDLQTGQAAATQTEAGGRIFVPDTHKGVRKSKGEISEPFKTSGAALTVWAVNRKDGLITESPNRATSATVVPGTDLGEFATPTGVSISSVTSTAATVPGSPGRHYDLAVVVAWAGLASRVEAQVTVGTKVYSEHVAVNQTNGPATVYFAHKFKLGDSVSVIAKVRNGTAESAFTGATIHTVGGGGVATIAGLTSLTRTETKQRRNIYSAVWALNTALRRLIIYKGGVWHKDIEIAKPDASGNLSSDITSIEFDVAHAQGASISVGAQLEDSAGQLSAITTEIGATPDPEGDVVPAAPTFISVSSSIDDVPGTKGIEASATITVGLPGVNQTDLRVTLTDDTNGKKHHRDVSLTGTEFSIAVDFTQFTKVGHSITVSRLRLRNRGAFTDAVPGVSFTAGGGATARPAAPSLAVIKRFTAKTKYSASLGIADTQIRQLEVWTAPNPGLAPTDNAPNPAGWTAEEPKNVHGPAKAGATSFNFTIHHQQSERRDVVARFVNSNGDLGLWSAVLDAGAVPETDASAPTGVAISSVTTSADPLPNNTGRQFLVSVAVTWNGAANQVDAKMTVNGRDHIEHVPVSSSIGSSGNSATIVFSKMFQQGQSGTLQVRARNANAVSAWVAYSLNPVIIGGSGGTLASPTITQFERNPNEAIYAVTWTANADLAYLQVQRQKADLTWVDLPKVDITAIASVGAVHISVPVKGATTNTAVFPNVRVRLQDTSGNLSLWVQLNGASQPSGTEFYIDNPTGWIDSGKFGLIGTGASANFQTIISQRNDGNKTLVPNLTDAIWPVPFASQAAAIDTVTGHFKSSIPNGQVVTYMEAANMRLAIFNATDGLWYRFNAATSIVGGTSGTPSDPPPGGGGTCFAASSLIVRADGKFAPISEVQSGDHIIGVDMRTGIEIEQRVLAVMHHESEALISWNGLRMTEHLLCRWCPNPYEQDQQRSKPPGLCEWITPEASHLGQLFWSRLGGIDGRIEPFEHQSISSGAGTEELVSLMTAGKNYWVGDGKRFFLAHNVKVLT